MKKIFLLLITLSFSNLFSQSSIWGTINQGGDNSSGAIFKADSNGNNLAIMHSFKPDAYRPGNGDSYIIKANNGKVYGIRERGGLSDKGVLFEYDPASNSFSIKVDFNADTIAANTPKSIIQHSNGKIYGITKYIGGESKPQRLFEYDILTNKFQVICDLPEGRINEIIGTSMFEMKNEKLYWFMDLEELNTENYMGSRSYPGFCEYDPQTKKISLIRIDVQDKYHTKIASFVPDDNKEFLYGCMENTYKKEENNLFFKYDLQNHKYISRVTVPLQDATHHIISATNNKIIGYNRWNFAQGYKQELFELDLSTEQYSILCTITPNTKIKSTAVEFFNFRQAVKNKYDNTIYLFGILGYINQHGYKGDIENYHAVIKYDLTTKKILNDSAYKQYNFRTDDALYLPLSKEKMFAIMDYRGIEGTGLILEYNIPSQTFTQKVDFINQLTMKPIYDFFLMDNTIRGIGKRKEFWGLESHTSIIGREADGVMYEYNIDSSRYKSLRYFNTVSRSVNDEKEIVPVSSTVKTNNKYYTICGLNTNLEDLTNGQSSIMGRDILLCEFDPNENKFLKKVDIKKPEKPESGPGYFDIYDKFLGPLTPTNKGTLLFLMNRVVTGKTTMLKNELFICEYSPVSNNLEIIKKLEGIGYDIVSDENGKVYIPFTSNVEMDKSELKIIEYNALTAETIELTYKKKNKEDNYQEGCIKDGVFYALMKNYKKNTVSLYEISRSANYLEQIELKINEPILGNMLLAKNGNLYLIIYKETDKLALVEINPKTKEVKEKSEIDYPIKKWTSLKVFIKEH